MSSGPPHAGDNNEVWFVGGGRPAAALLQDLPRMVAKYNFFLSGGQLATRILRVSSPPFDWMNANLVLMYATEK